MTLNFVPPNLDIHAFISDMPGFVMIKDLNSNYLNANSNTVNEFCLKNSDLLLGYTDLTIPHPLSKNGQLYRNLDLEVIESGVAMNGVCTFPFQGVVRPYYFKKSILRDTQGKCIATYSHAQECRDPALQQFIQTLMLEQPAREKNSLNNFILNSDYPSINLSSLAADCLFYLLRKKTKATIAKYLQVQSSQVDLLMEQIKSELQINHFRDLTEIAIVRGYINIVPAGICNQYIKNHMHSLSRVQTKNSEKVPNFENVQFTNREIDCIKLLLKGCRVKEIAAVMHLSPRTVESHLNNLKIKLNCRDKVELVIRLRDLY